MRFGGAGWKSGNRRDRRRDTGSRRPAENKPDYTMVIIIAVFVVLVLFLVILGGITSA